MKVTAKQLKDLSVCCSCQHFGHMKKVTPGSIWAAFFITGLLGIFLFWPLLLITFVCPFVGNTKRCPTCKSKSIVPAMSPLGQKAISQQGFHLEGVR